MERPPAAGGRELQLLETGVAMDAAHDARNDDVDRFVTPGVPGGSAWPPGQQ